MPIASPPVTRTSGEQKSRRQFFKHRGMMKNAGSLLNKFELSTIRKPIYPIEIKDFNFIASYNWSNSDEPVIFVPGCPARWSPPSLPYQVPKDNGQVLIDQNSHRSPSASFDPFFKALLTMYPNFNMKPIGLTTDRNSLRKLLQFVSGKVPKSWRIDVDVIEDTMFFTRWEKNKLQIVTGARDSGYGHEFEKAFLSFDSNLQESSGHHRINRYSLGGIDCLVRFEVDGYVDDGFGIDNQTSNETIDKKTSVVDWESRNQDHLRTLVGLISEIKEVAKSAKGGKCILVCMMDENPRVLKMYERNGKNFFLPVGVKEVCWGTENQKQEGRA